MRQTFTIKGRLPGLNEYTAANRTHRQAGSKMKREAQERVMWAIKGARLRPMNRQVDVIIHWIEPNMRRDKDNIRFAAKFILDALVEMNIIQNDDWKHIGSISDHYWVHRKKPRIVVELIEVRSEDN